MARTACDDDIDAMFSAPTVSISHPKSLLWPRKVWNCRGCDDGGNDAISLVMHARELDFRRAVEWLTGERQELKRQHPPTAPKPTDDSEARSNLRSAARIIAKLVAIRGTPGEAYLAETRKIDTGAITDALGWHPSVYFNEPGHVLHGQKLGCIVGVMTDAVTALPTGAISRTYVHEGRKLGPAKSLGTPAGIIRLSEDADVLHGLHVAEEIETALDAMARDWRPIWSTGSKSLIAKFPILSGIEALTIFADNDEDGGGLRAAIEAAARWLAAGREVHVYQRETEGDLNDAYREVRR